MGLMTLIILLALETVWLIWSITTKDPHREEKSIVRIALLLLFSGLLLSGVYQWSFRYLAILLVLVIQAIIGAVVLIRKQDVLRTTGYFIRRYAGNSLLFILALSLAILFPQYDQPAVTGDYHIATARYTWTDDSRTDPFSDTQASRVLTVEFWYPDQTDETFPLVVFSHGAFGFSGSNYSTFAQLVSHGYVVASIGHTGQAFYTKDTSGQVTIAEIDFISRAAEINANQDPAQEEAIYQTTSEWMKLRTGDEHFVIDTILALCREQADDPLFSAINSEHIGLMGHSLGGASSAQIGRERSDIDAVIVLDGTMLGEVTGYQNGEPVLNKTPYPVPLFNIYAEDHYTDSLRINGAEYSNFAASRNAVSAYETVFRDAGHLNFTDLPLFSPLLARLLGTGSVDERACIDTMNQVVLDFFDSCLKNDGVPHIAKDY
ncbi:MAG: hypothetical protein PHP40_08060 [Eubacteriales bacterium]|nr:hypothetical protein [Eubacteriales bacterium]